MKKAIFALILALMSLLSFAVSIEGPALVSEDKTGLRLVAMDAAIDESTAIFTGIKGSGINTVRINTGDGVLDGEPGVFDEKQIKHLDSAVEAAEKGSVKLIVSLAGDGIRKQYSAWTGASNDAVFFKDAICRSYFKDYVKRVLARYAKADNIIAWDMCADTQDDAGESGIALYDWALEMSKFIKSIDKTRFVTIEVKNAGTASYELFKIPSIDMYFFEARAPFKDGDQSWFDGIASAATAADSNVNKPIILDLKYSGAPADIGKALPEAAKLFFGSRGSVIIYDIAGATIDAAAASPDFLSAVKEAADYASSVKEKIIAASIKNIKAKAGIDTAEVSMNTDGDYDIKIMYGEKTPLMDFAELKDAKKGLNTLKITGLKPETKYMFSIVVSGKTAGGISKVAEFTTLKTPKLAAVKFTMSKNFIKAAGTDFYDGKNVYRYVGTNNYIMRKYYMDKTDKDKNRHIIDEIFEAAEKAGFKVIRVGSNGEAYDEASSNKDDITHDLRIGPENFNEIAYRSIDYVLDSARRHNIRVILHFTDNWEYYGGVTVYAKWAGVAKNDFWTNETCKKYYKQTVDAFVKRKNTVNGVLYRDDPTIFCYDLMNEPRNEADTSSKVMNAWVAEMSSYIKSMDPNHMITTGMEGFFLQADGTHYSGTDFILSHQPQGIDFCTFHLYPAGQYTHFSPGTTKWTIENFIKQAHKAVKKPVVMEEFGIPNGVPEYPKAQWIDEMTGEFFAAGGNGVNYWMLLDPSYTHGDGNEVYYNQTQYMNIFTKYANEVNKDGY